MAHLNPYLNFTNNCREAMTFYKDCLGGELVFMLVADMPEMAAQMPPEMKNAIMHSSLTNGNIILMGSDLNRDTALEGNTVQLCINCDNEAQLHEFFNKLSAGGEISEPVANMPWGAVYGALKDKYGKRWQLNFQVENQM